MKKTGYIFFLLFFLTLAGKAQDKLFLRNGSVIMCKIVNITEQVIVYKDTVPHAVVVEIPKNEVLMAELESGEVYIFSNNSELQALEDQIKSYEDYLEKIRKEWKQKEAKMSNDIIGVHFGDLLFGRATMSYEHLLSNKAMGITIPVSLSFNPFNVLKTSGNSNVDREKGVNMIAGLDVNYYYDLKPEWKYYFGPRIRYGTDMLLGGIEGLSAQLQNGIFKCDGAKIVHSVSVGFGFFKLSEKYAKYPGYEPKQVYPWMSFTWRLGFRL